MKQSIPNPSSAPYGTKIINDSTGATIDFYGIHIPENTVIESLKVEGSDDNIISEYISTPATSIKGPNLITIKLEHDKFTYIKLTSGSVNLLLLPQ